MFIEFLDNEKKFLFLNFAVYAANANNELDEDEKSLICMYAKQIEMEPIEKTEMSLDEIIDTINKTCDFVEKKMIIYEIIGVLLADKDYDDLEKAFLNNIAKKMSIQETEIDKMLSLMKEYLDLYYKTYEYILNK